MMLQWSNTVFFVLSSLIGLVLWPGMPNFSGLDMDFCFDGPSLVLRLHPYFTVWTSQLPEGVEGYALGFVAFCKAPLKDTTYGFWLEKHELKHLKQFRYLGPWLLVEEVRRELNVEGYLTRREWEKLEDALRSGDWERVWKAQVDKMWLPQGLPPLAAVSLRLEPKGDY